MGVLLYADFVPTVEATMASLMLTEGSDAADEVRDVVAAAAKVARPKAFYLEASVDSVAADVSTVGGVAFTSRVLAQNLASGGVVYPFVATCGTELEALEAECSDPLLRYAVDCVKHAALRASMECLSAHLQAGPGLAKVSTMSPGSGDAEVWPISEQRPLFRLLEGACEATGVTLTDSLLMVPNKTVSGIAFPTSGDFCTCRLCHREACPGRREPFDEHAWAASGVED